MFKVQYYRLLAAFQFFSRIPVPNANKLKAEHFAKSVTYLSWVGFVVSCIGAAVMYFSQLLLPKQVAVLLGMVCTILLTGAFHEDGVADVCDGFGASRDKQRILEIMKDSHIGTYGVIGLVMVLITRYIVLSEMPRFFMAMFFITSNTLSRYTCLTLMRTMPYARMSETSKSGIVVSNYNDVDLLIGALPLLPAFWLTGTYWSVLFIIPVWITKVILGKYFKCKIGGYTGDCMGATQQITEIVFYLAVLVWLKFTW